MLKSVSDTDTTIKTRDLEIYEYASFFFQCVRLALCFIQWSQLAPLPFSHSTSWSSPLWETAVWWIGGGGCHLYWWKANIYSVCHLKAPPSSACQFSSELSQSELSRNTPARTKQTLWVVYSYWQKENKIFIRHLKLSEREETVLKKKTKKHWIPTFPAVPSSPCGGNVYLVLSASSIRWTALKNKAIHYILFRHTQGVRNARNLLIKSPIGH